MRAKPRSIWLPKTAVEARVGKEKGVIAADDLTNSSPANHSPPMDKHEKKTANQPHKKNTYTTRISNRF